MASSSAAGLSRSGQVLFGSLCAGTFALGCWQTQRGWEKLQLVQERTHDLAMPVTDYHHRDNHHTTDTSSSTSNTATATATATAIRCWRRWQVQGRFDHRHEFLVGPRGPPPGALPDGPGTSAAGMSASPQGYFVITPFVLTNSHSNNNNNQQPPTVLLVNRGWVPRHLVVQAGDRYGRGSTRPAAAMMRRAAPTDHDTAVQVQTWDRPTDTVQLVVIAAPFEQPTSYLKPQHDLQQTPPRLFWFDRIAMHAAAGIPLPSSRTGTVVVSNDHDHDDNSHANGTSSDKNNNKDTTAPPLRLVTAVRNADDATLSSSWPVTPTAEKVGDFRVTPAVHAGYAFTWYGLSVAGLYMTRMLWRR